MVLLYNRYTSNERTAQEVFSTNTPSPFPSHDPVHCTLLPTNLPFGNRLDPAQGQVDGDGHDANDPNGLLIVRAVVPKDDGEDDSAKVAGGARAAGDDAVGKGVHVRYEAEDGTVGALEEEGHARHEAEHGALVVAVGEADSELEHAGEDREGVDEVFLAPDAGAGVDGVGYEAAEGAERHVQETKHGGPATGAALAEGFEVFEVVGAEDGVDGQFGAEGAEVAAAGDEGLQGEDDGHCLFEAGLANDFAAGDIEHLLFANLGLVVEATLALAGGIVLNFCVRVSVRGS